MQLEASNPIGGKGWARRSRKAPQCLLRFWLMKSQNHQTWKIIFCRPSTKKGLWTQPPKKENDHARVVCMCVLCVFLCFLHSSETQTSDTKAKSASQGSRRLLLWCFKKAWVVCLHLSTSPKKYSPSVSLKLQIPVVKWFPRTRVLTCEKMTPKLSLSLSHSLPVSQKKSVSVPLPLL